MARDGGGDCVRYDAMAPAHPTAESGSFVHIAAFHMLCIAPWWWLRRGSSCRLSRVCGSHSEVLAVLVHCVVAGHTIVSNTTQIPYPWSLAERAKKFLEEFVRTDGGSQDAADRNTYKTQLVRAHNRFVRHISCWVPVTTVSQVGRYPFHVLPFEQCFGGRYLAFDRAVLVASAWNASDVVHANRGLTLTHNINALMAFARGNCSWQLQTENHNR